MKTRWQIAFLVSAAIAISYLDRQTLPWAINAVSKDIPISNQVKAFLDSAFLVAYGLMYLGGGRLGDLLGTRRGFLLIMLFWSLACASHGLAGSYGVATVCGLAFSVLMLAGSRLLLGIGEGGGFPTATRAVAEWFPVNERATAMGIINGGTAVGAVVAPPLIALVLTQANWFGLAPWRWVFFITGAMGLLWTLWWWRAYQTPEKHPGLSAAERAEIRLATTPSTETEEAIPLAKLLRHRETWAVVFAKFLSDGAWYFYLFWLPKFLFDSFPLDIKKAGSIGWIPYAASGIGCLCGGGLSSWLLKRGLSVRLVGFGGAMGGVLLGQIVGYLRDHGYSYTLALAIAGSLHLVAFATICLAIPVIGPLNVVERKIEPVAASTTAIT
jgi:ACS family hexuronate transporter-like MFS transporter